MPKKQDESKMRFSGYQSPHYTIVPDELFDEQMVELSGAELKVLLYVIRHTYGFKKDDDNISISQMLHGITRRNGTRQDRGCGLSKPTLLQALRDLQERNLIIAERRISKEKGNEPTNYRLNVLAEPLPQAQTPPLVKKLDQGVGQETLPSPWSKNLTTQDTRVQETTRQETQSSNNFELETQVFNGVLTFQNSKKQIEFFENDESEEEPSGDEPEQQRRGEYQPLTPSTNRGFSAVGEVLKGRKVGSGRKPGSKSAKTASAAASSAPAGVRQGKGRNGLPEPPVWLREHITRLSVELHDGSEAQVERNLGQAHNLFLFTGAEEGRFQDRLNEAKRLTLRYDIEKRAEGDAGELFGQRNKMPYFFKVLRDLYGLKDVPASKTKPAATRRKGRGHNVNEQFYSP